jgi:uncharacterized membrane protein YobD (UPF0266 family)
MRIRRQHANLPVLAIASGLFVYAAYMGAPSEMFTRGGAMFANVTIGASAAVPPNEYNTLAQQLSDKEKELELRESAITQYESQNTGETLPATTNIIALLSLVASVLLSILVGLNFYFDWRRGQHPLEAIGLRPVINLRNRG